MYCQSYLCHNKLGILRAVQQQLLGNVSECDLAVCQGDCPNGGLDHIVVQPHDEGVGVICCELIGKLLDHLTKPDQVPRLNSLGELQVGVESYLNLDII